MCLKTKIGVCAKRSPNSNKRLRHTFITNLSLANVSPKTVQMLARHSDIKLTMQIYTHVNPEEQAKAINALSGLKRKKS